jgi:TIR domain/inactive STAND
VALLSFTFDVFVSYARTDRDFAIDLVRQLGRAGFRVWFDEEQVPAGAPIREGLARGLGAARHAVFVITEAWLDRDWTEWELEVFQADRAPERIAIPLLRIPRDVRRLGPYLAKQLAVHWPADDPDPLARLWLVVCGLRQEPAGPCEHWSERARASLGGNGPALAARTPAEREARTVLAARTSSAHFALTCDRAPQWGTLTAYAAAAGSHALFVHGSQGQGHEVFFERVAQCLPKDPRRRIRTVRWGPLPPTTRGTFLAALAEALDCRPEQLPATLRSQLAEQNLILLHRPVFEEDFDDDSLALYYTRWLPELLAEVEGAAHSADRWGLKLVQGVAWCRASSLQGGAARLLRRLGAGGATWAKSALERGDAQAALRRIERAASPRLPIVLLDELRDLRREDVLQWSLLLPEAERGRIVDRVMHGARDSAEILQRITKLYEEEDKETE